jgi:hypothetical protein
VTQPPPCSAIGRQCHSLSVTLRIGSLEEGDASLDHEATWLLGHVQHITFSELWEDEGELYVDATLHVPCRYLQRENGTARCTAFGYRAPEPRPRRRPQHRQLGADRFNVVDRRRLTTRRLPAPLVRRTLPVLAVSAESANPCATAPCRTADNRRGAACCRDLQVEIMCTKTEQMLERLVRARRSPYLCKVTRAGDFSIEAEMISACGYLEVGGVNCTLHGRARADGRPAKPDLCSEWPGKQKVLHPGCVFMKRPRRAR